MRLGIKSQTLVPRPDQIVGLQSILSLEISQSTLYLKEVAALVIFTAAGILFLILLSACAGPPSSAPAANTTIVEPQVNTTEGLRPVNTVAANETEGSLSVEIIVYASDLPQEALSELDFYDDPASPGGKFIGLPNNGDELDPPPENDPHLTFNVQVESGVPYRCWVHMKVGTPKGRSQANTVWVQFTDAVDAAGQEILVPGSGSYLTMEGPGQEGWTWVECDWADSNADSLIYFRNSGEITVRIQAGSEGVGFDQFLLSSGEFLNAPPSEAIVEK
jgi:hypothetical protein